MRFSWIIPLVLVTSPALAQSGEMEQRLREQLRQTVMELRGLQENQAILEAQKAAAEKERDALKKDAGKGSVSDEEVARLKFDFSAAEADARAVRGEAAQLRDALAKASDEAMRVSAERDQLRTNLQQAAAQLTDTRSAVQACDDKNAQLVSVGKDMVAAYEKLGSGGKLLARDPFFQFKRVALENQAQAFGDRVYENQFNSQTDRVAPAVTGPADAPAAPSPTVQP
jgi:colicin import membrane protein